MQSDGLIDDAEGGGRAGGGRGEGGGRAGGGRGEGGGRAGRRCSRFKFQLLLGGVVENKRDHKTSLKN